RSITSHSRSLKAGNSKIRARGARIDRRREETGRASALLRAHDLRGRRALDEEEMSAALLRIVSERREGDEIARLDLVRVGGDVESSRLAGLLRGEEIVPEVALREPAAERQKITTE